MHDVCHARNVLITASDADWRLQSDVVPVAPLQVRHFLGVFGCFWVFFGGGFESLPGLSLCAMLATMMPSTAPWQSSRSRSGCVVFETGVSLGRPNLFLSFFFSARVIYLCKAVLSSLRGRMLSQHVRILCNSE